MAEAEEIQRVYVSKSGRFQTILQHRTFRFPTFLLVIILVAITGTASILLSHAAPAFVSAEAENGTLSAPAQPCTDSTASNGRYVQFAGSNCGGGGGGGGGGGITGTSYFVDCTNGNDGNDGKSQATAWKSTAKANSASLSAGDGLLFKRGCSYGSGLVIKWSKVTIGNYGTGSLPNFTTSSDTGSIVSLTGSNDTIDGLQMTGPRTTDANPNANCSGCTTAGLDVKPGASNNTIQNSVMTGNYAGIFLRQDAAHNHVLKNQIVNNELLHTSSGDSGAFGILMWGNNNEVAYNYFANNYATSADYPPYDGSSIEVYTDSGNSPASNNVFHHNRTVNDNAFSELGKNSGASIPDNNVYAYNSYTASGQGNALFINTRGTSGDGYGPITHTKAYNNSIYITGATKAAAFVCQGTCDANAFVYENNIIVSSAGATSVGGAPGSGNITSAAAAQYVNPPSDLHLKTGSQAIDAGTNTALGLGFNTDLDGHKVPAGGKVDAGAYEFGSVAMTSHSTGGIAGNIAQPFHQLFALIGHGFGSLLHGIKLAGHGIASMFGSPVANAAAASTASASAPCVSSPAPATGQWKHVIVVIFENHKYSSVIGSKDAPYATKLASQCASSPSWNDADYISPGVKDPGAPYISKPNYFTYTSGVSPSTTAIGPGQDSSSTQANVDNIYRALRDIGKSSKDYGMGQSTGTCGGGWNGHYHDAIYYYTGVDSKGVTDQAYCKTHDVSLNDFTTDLNNNSLPDFSIVLPDNCHNGHSCSSVSNIVSNADNWAAGFFPQIFNSAVYKAGETAVFWVWDEDTPIPNVQIAPSVVPGTISPNTSHYGALLTWEQMLGTRLIGTTGQAVHAPESQLSVFTRGGGGGGGGGDTTAPTVSISSPASGSTVSASVAVNAAASDNVAVARVDFLVDGNVKASDSTAPYSFNLDTTTLSNGNHTISANAYDTAASPNKGVSNAVTVNVQNKPVGCPTGPPTTYGVDSSTITAPSSGPYHIWTRIKAPDSTNNSVFIRTDGLCDTVVGDSSSIPAGQWTWVDYAAGSTSNKLSATLTAGNHPLVVTGREPGVQLDRVMLLLDSCVPTGTGDNCTTQPDTTPPTATLTSPTANQTVGNPISLAASASDNAGGSGVSRVDFTLDGTVIASAIKQPYTASWDSSSTNSGSHQICAIAVDGAGLKSPQSCVTITLKDTKPPVVSISQPANNSTVSGTVTITATATDNVGLTGADVLVDGKIIQSFSSTFGVYNVSWNTTQYSVGSHTIQVKAKDTAGNVGSSPLVTVSVSNGDKTPPSKPSGLTASVVNSTTVNLSWQAATDNVGVAEYIITRNGANLSQEATGTTFTDTGLAAHTNYTYTVTAVDTSGNLSSPSSSVQVQTPTSQDTIAPTAPTKLEAAPSTDTQIDLSWGASTDSGGSGIAGYKIYRNSKEVFTTSDTSYGDTNLSASTTYSYTVKAFDGAGNLSQNSNTASATTKPKQTDNQDPPKVSLSSPSNGATVSGTVTVKASASSTSGIAEVMLIIDGKQGPSVLNPPSSSISLAWQTTGTSNGNHLLSVRAVGKNGQVAATTPINLNVSNGGGTGSSLSGKIVETEKMKLSSRHLVIKSSNSASGGKYVNFYVNGNAKADFKLERPATIVTLRAQGEQCNGAPHAVVTVDEHKVGSLTVTAGWHTYNLPTNLRSGKHKLTIAFDNDYWTGRSGCDRNLYVDATSFSDTIIRIQEPKNEDD